MAAAVYFKRIIFLKLILGRNYNISSDSDVDILLRMSDGRCMNHEMMDHVERIKIMFQISNSDC